MKAFALVAAAVLAVIGVGAGIGAALDTPLAPTTFGSGALRFSVVVPSSFGTETRWIGGSMLVSSSSPSQWLSVVGSASTGGSTPSVAAQPGARIVSEPGGIFELFETTPTCRLQPGVQPVGPVSETRYGRYAGGLISWDARAVFYVHASTIGRQACETLLDSFRPVVPAGSLSTTTTLPAGVMSAERACERVVGGRSGSGFFDHVEQVDLVLTTYAKGEPVEARGDISSGMPPTTLVWVVDVHAKAIHWNHSVPAGYKPPKRPDTEFSVVMNARTGVVTDAGESRDWPLPLWTLGTVVVLAPHCAAAS